MNESLSDQFTKTDDEAGLLKPVISDLLRTIPDAWAEFDPDSLTVLKSSATALTRSCRIFGTKWVVAL